MALSPESPLLVAVDTNVALDFADERDIVRDAISTIQARRPASSLFAPPTVVGELAFGVKIADEDWKRMAARKFLEQHRAWGFHLIHFVPIGGEVLARVSDGLRRPGLLPTEEVNDSRILAEAAALGGALLLTSDEHLRGIDFTLLTFALKAFDLTAPVIATPREIVQKFFR